MSITDYDYDDYWRRRLEQRESGDPLTPERVERFCRHLKTGDKVLDVGCGNGDATRRIASLGHECTGVDIALDAIEFARVQNPELRYEVVDADGKIPFEASSFDAIYCAEVIEHIYNVQNFLRDIARVMKPDGIALISTPYHGLLKNLMITLTNFEKHFDPTSPHIRFFTPLTLETMMNAAGLYPVAMFYLGRFRPFSKNMVMLAQRRVD